jgi:hypothetical protein
MEHFGVERIRKLQTDRVQCYLDPLWPQESVHDATAEIVAAFWL